MSCALYSAIGCYRQLRGSSVRASSSLPNPTLDIYAHGSNLAQHMVSAESVCRSSHRLPCWSDTIQGASVGTPSRSDAKGSTGHVRERFVQEVVESAKIVSALVCRSPDPPQGTSIIGLHWWQATIHLSKSGTLRTLNIAPSVQWPQPSSDVGSVNNTASARSTSVCAETGVAFSVHLSHCSHISSLAS